MSDIITDTTIYNGAPAECQSAGRLPKELETYALLDRLGIDYKRVDHLPAYTIEDCHAVDALLGGEMCKNLFLCNRQCTDFYLLMMPGGKPFKTKDITAQLGCARLSFADGEHMEKYLNITPGALSVLGLGFDTDHNVRLVIDRELLSSSHIGIHPCVNTSSLLLAMDDILKVFLPHTGHEPTFVDL
ncbi:MAG: prolyl-tRNA synthetase associated domain-containing protein [Clostridiales bacterium]|nr:prolyl-tRNA synthetase associated domain-containing protein [Clostridiales bacterium]